MQVFFTRTANGTTLMTVNYTDGTKPSGITQLPLPGSHITCDSDSNFFIVASDAVLPNGSNKIKFLFQELDKNACTPIITGNDAYDAIDNIADSFFFTPNENTPATNPPNLPIAATDSAGNIINGASNVITRPLTGFINGPNASIDSSDTILSSLEKVQTQINNKPNLGGNSGDILFNNGNGIDGSGNLTWTNASNLLSVTTGAQKVNIVPSGIVATDSISTGQYSRTQVNFTNNATGQFATLSTTGLNLSNLSGNAVFITPSNIPIVSINITLPDEDGQLALLSDIRIVRDGIAHFVADNVTTILNIPHGLGTVPRWYQAFNLTSVAGNYGARGVSADATFIKVTFKNAPTTIDGDADFAWEAKQ